MIHSPRLDRILAWSLSEQRGCLGLATCWSVHLTPDRSWLLSKLMDRMWGGTNEREIGRMNEEISFIHSACWPTVGDVT